MSQAPSSVRTDAPPALVARGLTKRFGKTVVLDGIDLEVARGEVVGIAGLDGAGKSTLVRLLSGLARPSTGTIAFEELPPAGNVGIAARQRIGVVLAGAPAFEWMTAREAIAFAAALADVPREGSAGRVDAALARAGLQAVAEQRIEGLGSEIRRWIAVAQALVAGPSLVLIDEPPSAFEPGGRARLRDLVSGLRADSAVVITSHRLGDLAGLADRLVLLDAGRVVTEGSTLALLGRFAPATLVIDTATGTGLALEGLVARLAREPWVRAAGVSGSSLRVIPTDEGRAAHELLPAVVATGVHVTAFRREPPELADVLAAARAANPLGGTAA